MKKPFMTLIVTAVATVAMLPVTATPAFAQGKYTPPSGPAPQTPDGHPDFSGVWERPYTPDMTITSRDGKTQVADQSLPDDPSSPARGPKKKLLPFTARGKAEWEAYDAAKGDYTGACFPFGLIRSINSPDPLQLMQSPKYLGELFEQNTWFHIARINGTHPKDLTPTWFGDSVAKWDGNTLVIDTIGFNDRTKLDTIGHPHSDQMHVTERYSRPDLGHINYEITIDDPAIFTKPWKNTRIFTLRTDWQIMEYSCEENNKDFFEGHIKGIGSPGKPVSEK